MSGSGPARFAVVVVLVGALWCAASAGAATYSQTQTLPVPPASSFSGSSGGDGWDLSVGSDRLYNVYHHNGELDVACRRQVDAQACWGSSDYKTILDANNNGWATGNHSS